MSVYHSHSAAVVMSLSIEDMKQRFKETFNEFHDLQLETSLKLVSQEILFKSLILIIHMKMRM